MKRILPIVALLAIGCAAQAAKETKGDDKAFEGSRTIADLYVVDCLLPGQVRQLGTRTYLTARRPIKTTAADCRIRGGEYVAYDRADYKSALNVWMPSAEAGDAEAQVNVGEIFERGLGSEPNYEAALIWYRKAAAQGNTRAQFNLGTLYEQGLGIERDPLAALNWYRQAWGLEADDVIFASAAQREQDALRAELEAQLDEKNDQLELLKRQLGDAEAKLSASSVENSQAQREARTLKGLIAQLEEQQKKQREQLASIPRTREPQAAPAPKAVEPPPTPSATLVSGVNLGRYFALLIGNQDYDTLEDLNSPLNDIARAKEVLEQKYGFTVLTIADGDNTAVMEAINDLNEIVEDNDNLLIFYAGHGARLSTGDNEIGYWLPTNADAPPRDTYWVPNEFVTGHLSRLKAKRVLLVVDSCYAGLLSAEPTFLLLGNNTARYSDPDFLRFKLGKRARLLLTSGGDKPVLDGTPENHSVFARAFLDALAANDGILSGPDLYVRIRDRVVEAAARVDFDQRPELKTIKAAGHEVGDFFFVPK